ncbi:hypothetical protein [Nocardioides sp.]|uniref:hypothetical protein n=1 Tax=Nocardioides sp. TaxID=35761 RepID=UPI003515557A
MSDSDHLPQDPTTGWSAPGSTPAPAGPPATGPTPAPGWGPPPAYPTAAAYPSTPAAPAYPGPPVALHKPGAIPLRPLTLGDIYNGAFRTIRANPRATVGAAVLMSVLAMSLPLVLSLIATFTLDVSLDENLEPQGSISTSEAVGIALSLGGLALGTLALYLGTALVSAMVSQVTLAAAVGARMSLEQAWRATRGLRWRAIGLILLLAGGYLLVVAVWGVTVLMAAAAGVGEGATIAWAVLSGLFLLLPALVVLWTRYSYLAVPALMLERRGVVASIGVAGRLTRGAFWRTFGIALLTVGITLVASNLLSTPVSLVGQVVMIAAPDYALLTLTVTTALTSVVATAFVAPFSGAVSTLQYLDQRMRREGFEVELMRRAGLLG